MQTSHGNNLPVSLTGDFNSDPNDVAYKTLAAAGYVKEMYGMATAAQRSGPYPTYTGFLNEASSRIDFIWLGPTGANSSYAVNKYTVIDNLVNGTMMSDHRPVVGDVTLS
jgi:endonuclease/exonuclease/phosphatase family metal-dependent hydrolase